MISTLYGVVAEKLNDKLILDVNGVGYGLFVTIEDFANLNSGDKAKLYIYEHIREQSYDLFGFIAQSTMWLFEQLLGVNGVGPKMALSVMSVGSGDNVRAAIATGDVKFIQQANGVGKRVAERIVVDLKDKVGLEGVDLSETGILQADVTLLGDEAVEALVSLGYSPQDATTALRNIDKDISTEERIKLALKGKN